MGKALFSRIDSYFGNRGYQTIPTDSPNVSMYGVYEKNNLYLINVIEIKQGYDVDPDRYLEYKQITMQQFQNNHVDKVILLNIIIADHANELTETFNYVPDMTEHFIDVLWFVDREQERLLIPSKQPKGILGLKKALKKLLNNEPMSYYEVTKRAGWPIITTLFFVVNLSVWLYMEYIGSSTSNDTLLQMGALFKPYVLEKGQYYRLVTSMFLHIGFLHLFQNLFALSIFGYRLEQYLKRWQFGIIYLGSGLVGAGFSLVVSIALSQTVIAAGASGAIYGLMGSLTVITKILKKPIDGVNTYVIVVMFILGIVYSVIVPGVDIACHIGGFISGVLLTYIILRASRRNDLEEEGN